MKADQTHSYKSATDLPKDKIGTAMRLCCIYSALLKYAAVLASMHAFSAKCMNVDVLYCVWNSGIVIRDECG